MATFAIATAASIALNLAISALTADYSSKKDNDVPLKSSFGFPLEKPFGKVRLRSRNVFWGMPIDDDGGGGGKGRRRGDGSSYATFAVMGGWEQIKRVTKIWIDNELFFEFDGTDYFREVRKAKKRRHFDGLHIFYGTDDQPPSSIIERREGIGNVPAFKKRFYLVFEKLQVGTGGTYPTVDIEVESLDSEKSLPQVLTWACKAKGLSDGQIVVDPVLAKYTNVNIDLEQNGGTIADFIKELQKTYFFIVIDKGDRLIFRDYTTPESLPIVNLSLDNLAATVDNSQAIDRYLAKIPDDLDLPSELQFEYISAEQNYDMGNQPAFRYDAKHFNDINVNTRQILTDTEANNIAWKTLEILWTQSRRLEKLMLLPSIGRQIEMGSLFTVPIDGVNTTFQVETVEIGDNNLIEVNAVSYSRIETNFVSNISSFPNQPIPEIPTGSVVALDIPLVKDSDADLGIYVGVTSAENWKYGAIFVSDNNGDSYTQLTNFTGKSTVGTVTQIPQPNNPDVIDYGSQIIIQIPNGGVIESIPEADFLDLKQMGLFGNEIIAWQNAELIAEDTYKLTKLIRGLRGTNAGAFRRSEGTSADSSPRGVNQHSANETFILLRGTGARLVRVPGTLTDIGKTLLFKAIHGGQTLDEITDETSLLITGEAIKPYAPANPEILINTPNNNLTIEWALRTRRYGQWRNEGGIIHSDTNQSTLEILSGSGTVVQTVEIFNYDNPSYTFTAAEQINKFGSLQTELSFNVYQVSEFIGRGYALEVRNMQPSKFK